MIIFIKPPKIKLKYKDLKGLVHMLIVALLGMISILILSFTPYVKYIAVVLPGTIAAMALAMITICLVQKDYWLACFYLFYLIPFTGVFILTLQLIQN